jgi:DNA helicase-2/ATP-dependent DNA helicase PcrA
MAPKAIVAKYPILAVDEYQDLGVALHAMVMGLCFKGGMRLFAVGDVDQSIYGFTGAHPELLRRLSEREDVETIRLGLNYRCGSRIVSASEYALGEARGYRAPDDAHEGTIFFHPRPGGYASGPVSFPTTASGDTRAVAWLAARRGRHPVSRSLYRE